ESFVLPTLNQHTCIKVEHFDMTAALGVAQAFPGLTTLHVAVNEGASEQLIDVSILLQSLSATLETLQLFIFNSNLFLPNHVSHQLFGAINSLQSLRVLSLDFNFVFNTPTLIETHANQTVDPVDLPIIAQLDEFDY